MKKATSTIIIASLAILNCLLFAYATGLNTLVFPIRTSATVPINTDASLTLGTQTIINGTTFQNFNLTTLTLVGDYWISNQTLTITNTGNTNLTTLTITPANTNYTAGSQIQIDSNGITLATIPIDDTANPQTISGDALYLTPSVTFYGYLVFETPITTAPNNYSLDLTLSLT